MSYKKGHIKYITQNIGSERMLFSFITDQHSKFQEYIYDYIHLWGTNPSKPPVFLMFIVFNYPYLWLSVYASYTQSGHL